MCKLYLYALDSKSTLNPSVYCILSAGILSCEKEDINMQIRCFKCHMPIAMNRDQVYEALDLVEEQGLSHYDVRCPKCRKMNRVSQKQLKRAAPRRNREED
jgi:phage FluMu protein Com